MSYVDEREIDVSNLEDEEVNKVDYVEEPIQLINFDNQGFKLNPEALHYLNSIQDDLIIVSVVGKARTGKSYLMNLLLNNVGKTKGFKVDSKISSCTKGIWIWGNYRKSLTGNNKIIFIDSEGTSATDRGTRTYDSRIFALIVLISSLFVYNTTSNIDEHGISELSLAAHLSNAISTNSNIDVDNILTQLSPKFIWVLRDFTLEKVHPETGQEISSKEYLEICLRKKISGKNSSDNNLIRNNIIKYFPERDCVTLVRPVESETDLQRLNDIPLEKLKSNFILEFKNLKDKIYKETLPKKFNGKKLNGPTLANLLIEFVNTINSGTIPNINNSWDSVIDKDIKDYKNKALTNYKHKTNKLSKQILEQEDIVRSLYDSKLESMMIYNKLLVLDSETFINTNYAKLYEDEKSSLIQEIGKIEEKLINLNVENTNAMCKDLIKTEFKDIDKKMFDNYYSPKLLSEFVDDYSTFLNRYSSSDKSKGSNKLKILAENLITKEKGILDYLINIYKKENDTKINKVDRELREINFAIEDGEKLIKNSEEINSISESRIRQLEKNIQIEHRHIQDLKERLENLSKEAELVKQSKEQGITYKKKDLEEIVDKIDKRQNVKGNKKESCQCRCLIY